jgi:hypothetical protein
MALGIKRIELEEWKQKVRRGEIAFLTHYWLDHRFPGCDTVTKVGCRDLNRLTQWGEKYGLDPKWIDQHKEFPHFDLFDERQKKILREEGQWSQLNRFNLL